MWINKPFQNASKQNKWMPSTHFPANTDQTLQNDCWIGLWKAASTKTSTLTLQQPVCDTRLSGGCPQPWQTINQPPLPRPGGLACRTRGGHFSQVPCRPTGHKRPATQRPALSLSIRRSKRTLSNGSRLTDYTSPGKALLPDHSVNIIDGRARQTGRSAERRERGKGGGGGEGERERSMRWYHSLRITRKIYFMLNKSHKWPRPSGSKCTTVDDWADSTITCIDLEIRCGNIIWSPSGPAGDLPARFWEEGQTGHAVAPAGTHDDVSSRLALDIPAKLPHSDNVTRFRPTCQSVKHWLTRSFFWGGRG